MCKYKFIYKILSKLSYMIFIFHKHLYRFSSSNLMTQPYITTNLYNFHELYIFTIFVKVIKNQ